jgi:hypothetical protein
VRKPISSPFASFFLIWVYIISVICTCNCFLYAMQRYSLQCKQYVLSLVERLLLINRGKILISNSFRFFFQVFRFCFICLQSENENKMKEPKIGKTLFIKVDGQKLARLWVPSLWKKKKEKRRRSPKLDKLFVFFFFFFFFCFLVFL